MKPKGTTVFSRIIWLVAAFIAGLGLVFVIITYIVATKYYESSTQLLNKDVAVHIARFTAPFNTHGLDHRKADSVFHDAMVLSPNSEVYFLDTTGKVIDYHASEHRIRQWEVSLEPVRNFIASRGQTYIKAADPRDPEQPKIFSAAEVVRGGRKLGYIYVILASSEARSVAALLLNNHVIVLSIAALICVMALSLLLSFLYVRRIQTRFNRVVDVLDRFQGGDFEARFQVHAEDSLGPIKSAFNTMADLLVYHINRLTKSEADRKAFIAGITHDIRNPLSIAGGYAETLLIKSHGGDLAQNQMTDYMQLMLQKVRQVEHLVEQLHELSALESVTFEPKREPFLFSELLQEVVQSFRQQASEKQIDFDCQRCHSNAFVFADIGMIERVIQNLVSNAVAYADEHSTITVLLSQVEEELCFTIRNFGPPLPPSLLQWLKEDNATVYSPVPNTTSLGLSIVRRILRSHGYTLAAGNQDGVVTVEVRMTIHQV